MLTERYVNIGESKTSAMPPKRPRMLTLKLLKPTPRLFITPLMKERLTPQKQLMSAQWTYLFSRSLKRLTRL
jgi:hypothetical protein